MITIGFLLSGYMLLAGAVALVGMDRRIGFWTTFLICLILSPFMGLFIGLNSSRLDARGCMHCGNKYNEAEFCGVCKKNEQGLTKQQLNLS